MCILIWNCNFFAYLEHIHNSSWTFRKLISVLCNGILELTRWLEGCFHLVNIDRIRCRITKENHVVLCPSIHQYVVCEPIFYCTTVSYLWGEPILYRTGNCTTNAVSVDVFTVYKFRTFFSWPIVHLDLAAVALNVGIKPVKTTTYGTDQPKAFPWLTLGQTTNSAQ